MRVDMNMPQMGESITEATISKWLKKVGETVKKDEIILEISTDKVDSEIPAPASGTLAEVLCNEGDVVAVKTKIAVIDTDGKGAVAAPSEAPKKIAPAPVAQEVSTPASKSHASPSASSEKFYSPLVKGLAEKHGVSLSELDGVTGSGQGGRLTKEDFMQYLESRGQKSAATPDKSSQAKPSAAATKPSATIQWDESEVKVVPMDNMRKLIAEHMVRSKQTSPHVYSVTEVDVTNISKWRAKNQSKFLDKEGFKLSFTPFFLEAAVQALIEFPGVNASVDGQKVVYKKHINLGCAVALGTAGLIVPVIKKAEEKNFVGIARGLNDLANRARNKKLMPDDVANGTFTVTNPGVFGTIIGYPIINQPQVAILSLGAIKKRPVVIDDMIAIREMCYLSLSYDHRIIDGAMGGSFLSFIKSYLESWDIEKPLY